MTMLLPSFNLIGGKERMKFPYNFHLTKVKQDFFLFLRAGAFYGLKNKKIYNNNSYFILWRLI